MKTNIEIDEILMADALKTTGLSTADQVIELALKMLVQLKRQEHIKSFRGKLSWEGDLNLMRIDA